MRRELGILAALVVGCVVLGISNPDFTGQSNVVNTLRQISMLGIFALGSAFVIITGGIDLSVGSVIGFTTVFLAIAIQQFGMPPWLAFVAILLICAAFGTAMGAVIQYFDLPPFIVTLAGMFLARGTSFLMSTESIPINSTPT